MVTRVTQHFWLMVGLSIRIHRPASPCGKHPLSTRRFRWKHATPLPVCGSRWWPSMAIRPVCHDAQCFQCRAARCRQGAPRSDCGPPWRSTLIALNWRGLSHARKRAELQHRYSQRQSWMPVSRRAFRIRNADRTMTMRDALRCGIVVSSPGCTRSLASALRCWPPPMTR